MSKEFYADDNLDVGSPDKEQTFYGDLIVKIWLNGAPNGITSFFWSIKRCKTMVGNVVIETCSEQPMPIFAFEEIIGDFSVNCPNFPQEYLDNFSKVRKIKGNVSFARLTSNLSMDCLEEIDGDLVVSSLPEDYTTVSFARLKKIRGRLIVDRTANVKAPVIEEIGAIAMGKRAHCTLSANVKIISCEAPSPKAVDAEDTYKQPPSSQMKEEELKSFISAEVEKIMKEKFEESNSNAHNKKSGHGLLHRLKKCIGLKSKEEETSLHQ